MITTYHGPTNYDNECNCEDCVAARNGIVDPEISSTVKLDQYNVHRKRKNHS